MVASVLGSLGSVIYVVKMGVMVGREVVDAPREGKIRNGSLLDICDSANQAHCRVPSYVVRRDPLTSL